jgi:hypothetical protein
MIYKGQFVNECCKLFENGADARVKYFQTHSLQSLSAGQKPGAWS